MVFDVITPQKYKKEHTKQNKPKENFISMQKNICREAHTMHPYSLHHAIQFQLYYQTILPILRGNMAEISAQYGWNRTATRLKVSCLWWGLISLGLVSRCIVPATNKKKSPEDIAVFGAPSKKRRLPTLPHCIAVPSAQAGLTSLFGMGRGGTPPQ